MIQLSYTSKYDILLHIYSLAIDDYFDGPCRDNDALRIDDVWIFAPIINNLTFYVKLKITRNQLKCLSFHEAEWPITFYPFK
jgi:hypothetical protein